MAAYVGSAGGANGAVFSNTLTFTTTRTIEIGERVVVSVKRAGVTVSSLSVGSLSLSLDVSAGNEFEFWSKQATSQIASGATVTITFSAETSGANKNAIVDVLSGIDDTTPFRASASNAAFGSTMNSGTTDTTPQSGDLAICGFFQAAATTITGFGGGLTAGNTGLTRPQSGYEVLTASGADSGTATLSAGDDYKAAICVYRAAAAAQATLLRPAMVV